MKKMTQIEHVCYNYCVGINLLICIFSWRLDLKLFQLVAVILWLQKYLGTVSQKGTRL